MQQDGFHGGHFPEAGPRNCKRALARFVPVFVKHASAPETVGTLLECVLRQHLAQRILVSVPPAWRKHGMALLRTRSSRPETVIPEASGREILSQI